MCLAGLALAGAADPDRWLHVGGSAGLYAEYLDRDSVRRSGQTVTLWTRRDFVRGPSTAWHEIELDCAARTDIILAYVRDDGGTVSHNVARPHRGPAPIPPNSAAERIFDLVCR